MLGLVAFAALVTLSIGGLYLIYLLVNGELFPSLYCVFRVYYFCSFPGWAIVALAVSGFVLALWLIMVLQVLLFGVDPPDGIAVSDEDAPELFALIERVAGERGADALDAVVIDFDCNASVLVYPSFGLVGPMKINLVIGLPLLDAIDEQELPALLSHELAHLHDHSGALDGTAQRVGAVWQRIGLCCAGRWVPGAGLWSRFATWYLGKMDALRLRQSRQQEIAADAVAAANQGTDASVTVILRVAVASLWFEQMWKLFPKRLRRHNAPRFRPVHVAPRWFRKLERTERFEQLLRVALVQATSRRDTHPAWHERIAALGPNPRVPPPVRVPASRILGGFETKLREDMHTAWLEQVSDLWCEQHESMRQNEQQLASLEQETADGGIEPEEMRLMAHLTRELRGAEHAIPLFRDLLNGGPEDAEMHFGLGEAMLDLGDNKGLLHLEKARALDRGLSAGVIALVSDFLASSGDMARARSYCAEIDCALDEFDLAEDERLTVTRNDVLDPHGLDRVSLAQITARVVEVSGVRRAWLARKRVQRLQARPCLVLVVEYSAVKTWLGTADAEHEKLLVAFDNLEFDMFCLRKSVATGGLLANIKALPGSAVFDRETLRSSVASEMA